MKLGELKAKVYELAEVSSTRQLKAKYEEIRLLDLRRKLSWEQTLTIVKEQKQEFQKWLESPPEEYKDLFAEIDMVFNDYDRHLAEAEQHGKDVISMADSLQELAEECQDEADLLKQEVKAARQIAQKAHLN